MRIKRIIIMAIFSLIYSGCANNSSELITNKDLNRNLSINSTDTKQQNIEDESVKNANNIAKNQEQDTKKVNIDSDKKSKETDIENVEKNNIAKNQEQDTKKVNIDSDKKSKETDIENTENNITKNQEQDTKKVNIDSDKKSKETDICTKINYRNQYYLKNLKFTAYNGEKIDLYRNRNIDIKLPSNIDRNKISDHCQEIADKLNRTFGFRFDKKEKKCICAYGSIKE